MDRHTRQKGFVLVLVAIALPVLFSLVILALDLGNLYLAQDRLNKIARLSTSTALNMRAMGGGWGALVTDDMQPGWGRRTGPFLGRTTGEETILKIQIYGQMFRTVDVALTGYYGQGESTWLQIQNGQRGTWAVSFDANSFDLLNDTIQFRLRYARQTLLLGRLGNLLGMGCQGPDGSNDRCFVQSAPGPTAEIRPANIFLLLDTSGSMNGQVEGGTKLAALKNAASQFVDYFNPNRDRFSVIQFGTVANQAAALGLAGRVSNADSDNPATKFVINGLGASGQTNPCHALQIAQQQITQVQAGIANNFVVVFTDGAPNVYRLGFQNPANQLVQRNEPWFGWTVNWGQRVTDKESREGCQGANDIECDPVFGQPRVERGDASSGIAPVPVRNGELSLDEAGQFRYIGKDRNGNDKRFPISDPQLNGGPYQLVFRPLSRVEDNYLWHGPSYLVQNLENLDGLIDRVPVDVPIRAGQTPPVTCGPGGGTLNDFENAEKSPELYNYNHSRYFASRVVNARWSVGDAQSRLGLRYSQIPFLLPSKDNRPGLPLTADQTAVDRVRNHFDPNGHLALPTKNPGCLNSLDAVIPGTPAQIFVGGDGFVSNNGNFERGEIVKTAELPYYCAIRTADVIRTLGAVVFTVGLGPSASTAYGVGCNDPLQNALDVDSRKDNFLRRLAFAPESIFDPSGYIAGGGGTWEPRSDFGYRAATSINCNNHPLNGVNINIGYGENAGPRSNLPNTQPGPQSLGGYYPSSDPANLPAIFAQVAKQILFRLGT